MFIYVIKNKINEKRYVGKTINNVEMRFQKHVWESLNPQSTSYNFVFHQAIRKYGVENFIFEHIFDCNEYINDDCSINDIECKAIEYYNTYIGWSNNNGYNSTLGGEGYARDDIKIDAYTKSLKFIGTYESIELAARELKLYASNIWAVVNGSSTTRSTGGYVFVKHNETPEKFKNNHNKKVDIYDLNKCFIKTCLTLKEASEYLNGHIHNVYASCRRKQFSCNGHICLYHGVDIKNIDDHGTKKCIDIYNAKTNEFIGTYLSMTSVMKIFGIGKHVLQRCLRSDNHLAGDYLIYPCNQK